MMKFKIANVLLSDDPQFLYAPALLCRADRPFSRSSQGDDAWTFSARGSFDFTTFFNALSVAKWRKYTVAEGFGLHLQVRGGACSITQTWADSFSWYSSRIEETRIEVPASDTWLDIEVDLASVSNAAVEGFILETQGDVELRGGYYYASVPEDGVREVELALCTTTFKKEEFITRNIELVKKEILDSPEPIAEHFHMHVVDNGRTLDPSRLEGRNVSIYPNDNVGGAGGFARGMICAMEQEPKATNVLLMDDDVLISAESIIRTFNLLRIVNDVYSGAFLSGAMMNMDEPNIRWEDMGFIGRNGKYYPLKPMGRMDVLNDLVESETFDIPSYLPGYEDQAQHYAAWWYCVIPMSAIEENGLPLPIFVRGDDVEYSRRCKPEFMTLNGICVWHLSFHLRYNAAQERYQMTRNCFIGQFTTDIAEEECFEADLKKNVELELKKFNYASAELILQGFEDFLRGPEWIMRPNAQKAFMDANAASEKLKPLEEVYAEASEMGIDLQGLTVWNIERDLSRTRFERAADYLTVNGQRFGGEIYTKHGKVAVIGTAGWLYPAGKIRQADTIVAIDPPNRAGIIRRKDGKRFEAIMRRYKDDLRVYKAKKRQLKKEYAAARAEMTTVAFWKDYLGI